MRPVKLILCGWGPYPGEEAIDFSHYDTGELFLIAGPTGSGKTTIFDAVTYALYGMMSGKNRERDSVRSDFAKPETETFVELSFSHRGKSYRVRRSPKYERPKKRGAGFITKSETTEFYEEGKAPLTAVKEVNHRLLELLGLSYEQYKQIAMIAQGEFMELLLADSRQRVAIFRNLFKTGSIERVQKILSEKTKLLETRLRENKQRIQETLSMTDTEGFEELADEIAAEYPSYERIEKSLAICVEQDADTEKELNREIGNTEKQLKKLLENGQVLFEVQKRREAILRECVLLREKLKQAVLLYEEGKKEKDGLARTQQREREALIEEKIRQKDELASLKEKLLLYEGFEKEEGAILLKLEKLKNEKDAHLRLQKKIKEKEAQEENLRKKQRLFEAAFETVRQVKETYEKKEALYRAAAIGLAARFVEEGKPCPVCGSLTHPKVAKLSREVPQEKEVETWKKKWQREEKALEEIHQMAVLEKGILDAQNKELEEAGRMLLVTEENREAVFTQLLEKEACLEKQRDALEEKKRRRRDMEKLYSDGEKKWNKLLEKEESLRERQDKQRERTEQREKKLKEDLVRQEALLKQKESEQIKIEKEEESLLKDTEMIAIKEEIKNIEKQKKQLQLKKEAILSRRRLNSNALSSLRDKKGVLQELEGQYGVYKDLDNVTRGNNKDRVVFEHYVLSSCFEEVLRAANVRFTNMSGGRFELFKVEKVTDARTTDSMELQVLDNYTGKRRSVKTLSGGEAFKAALSLALGLSDVVQKNAGGIVVETLFIDEGFGSLDEESLEQALESLMKLSGRRQMIGIISHVAELKERIEHQIVIKKSPSGSRICCEK